MPGRSSGAGVSVSKHARSTHHLATAGASSTRKSQDANRLGDEGAHLRLGLSALVLRGEGDGCERCTMSVLDREAIIEISGRAATGRGSRLTDLPLRHCGLPWLK